LGAVSLVSTRRKVHFDGPAIEFLGDIAQQVALGVENARLFLALSQMASTDELTQLANRRRFTEALRRELGRARRTGLPLSLVLGTGGQDGATEERLGWVADQRLYAAKEGGRNRVCGGPPAEGAPETGSTPGAG